MRKIFEQPIAKPLSYIQKNIEGRLAYFDKKYPDEFSKYRIIRSWNKKSNTLYVESLSFSIKAKIKFTKKKVVGYIEMSILLMPIFGRYGNNFIKEILKEIESL